jgi:hypothetical protein
MKILALDMATDTGWAHSCGASGVWDLSVLADESSGMRLIRFEAKIHEIAKTIGIDLIAFESITAARGPKANLNGVKLGCKLQAIVERLSEIYEYECKGYNLATIKAHALPGAKTRDKAAMVAAANKRWPEVELLSDDQADALWLLDLVQKQLVKG